MASESLFPITTSGPSHFTTHPISLRFRFLGDAGTQVDTRIAYVRSPVKNAEIDAALCLVDRSISPAGLRVAEAVYFYERMLATRNQEMVAGFYLHGCLQALYAGRKALEDFLHNHEDEQARNWYQQEIRARLMGGDLKHVWKWRGRVGHNSRPAPVIRPVITAVRDVTGVVRVGTLLDSDGFSQPGVGIDLDTLWQCIRDFNDILDECRLRGFVPVVSCEDESVKARAFVENEPGAWFAVANGEILRPATEREVRQILDFPPAASSKGAPLPDRDD